MYVHIILELITNISYPWKVSKNLFLYTKNIGLSNKHFDLIVYMSDKGNFIIKELYLFKEKDISLIWILSVLFKGLKKNTSILLYGKKLCCTLYM